MALHRRLSLALAALGLGALACGDAREVATGRAVGACTECHHQDDLSTGAHAAHLHPGALAGALTCDACHPVPATVDAPGHADGEVTFAFGSRATAGGALSPTYDPRTKSCASVYCHGAFVGGNSSNPPVWTGGADEAACGTCHGNANATPVSVPVWHPLLADGSTNATCNVCHPGTVTAGGAIDVAAGLHVNGDRDFDDAASHPPGWLDRASEEFHGLAAATEGLPFCFRCHSASAPAQVTTVVCNGCHDLIGEHVPSP